MSREENWAGLKYIWGIYLCKIYAPNLFSTQQLLGRREVLSLVGLFCLFAAESAEPGSTSESRLVWTMSAAVTHSTKRTCPEGEFIDELLL